MKHLLEYEKVAFTGMLNTPTGVLSYRAKMKGYEVVRSVTNDVMLVASSVDKQHKGCGNRKYNSAVNGKSLIISEKKFLKLLENMPDVVDIQDQVEILLAEIGHYNKQTEIVYQAHKEIARLRLEIGELNEKLKSKEND